MATGSVKATTPVNRGGTGATTSKAANEEFIGSNLSVMTDTVASGTKKKYSGALNGFRGFIFVFYPGADGTGMYLLTIINSSWYITTVIAPTSSSIAITYDTTGITINNKGTSYAAGVRFVNMSSSQFKVLPTGTVVT